MVQETSPRFEFRIFGQDLEAFVTVLEAHAPRLKTRYMNSIYLLTAGNAKNNIKIRDGIMDIKGLEQEADGLEQWNPFLVGEFPLSNEVIKNVVFPALGIVCPVFERSTYSLPQFLSEIISVDPDLSIAYVKKVRHGYTLNNCITEFAEVNVNGASIQTLCIEHENPAKVHEAIKIIGLDKSFTNESYPMALKRIMGVIPLSEEYIQEFM